MASMSQRGVRPLTAAQERKLMDFLEEKFLDLTRNYKKRSDPSSTLQTLSAYLTETHTLMSLILQIPPVDPSASLRITLLLRLTGEVMGSVTGYKPDTQTLLQLLDWLDELDCAWLAVLRFQAWDAEAHTGIDKIISSPSGEEPHITSSPMSQTERTRLRSLLISGTGNLEEWLTNLDNTGQDYEAVLESMGLQQGFDDLFSGTLMEMGSLNGSMNAPEGMEGTC